MYRRPGYYFLSQVELRFPSSTKKWDALGIKLESTGDLAKKSQAAFVGYACCPIARVAYLALPSCICVLGRPVIHIRYKSPQA